MENSDFDSLDINELAQLYDVGILKKLLSNPGSLPIDIKGKYITQCAGGFQELCETCFMASASKTEENSTLDTDDKCALTLPSAAGYQAAISKICIQCGAVLFTFQLFGDCLAL